MSKRPKIIPGCELKLTSAKVLPVLLEKFQETAIHQITFQSLVNRSLDMYVRDAKFRSAILSHTDLLPSGSL